MSSKRKQNAIKRGTAQHAKYIDMLQLKESMKTDEDRFYGEIDTEQVYLMALAEHFHFGPKMFEKLDKAVKLVRASWAAEVLKDAYDKKTKLGDKSFWHTKEEFDKILNKHMSPAMQTTWEQRWDRSRQTMGIRTGPTDEQLWASGEMKELRIQVGWEKEEDKND